MALVMARGHDTHALLLDGFLILAESLAELGTPAPASAAVLTRKDARMQRLVSVESSLAGKNAAERAEIVRTRLGLSKSAYYRIRAAAQGEGLL